MLGSDTLGVAALGVSAAETVDAVVPQIALRLRITVGDGRARVALPLRLAVAEAQPLHCGLRITIAPAAVPAPPVAGTTQRWTVGVLVGSVDMSARITGQVSVIAAEGEARTAEFALVAPAGAIAVAAYVGQAVVIDYIALDEAGAEAARTRWFTGVVDVPSIDIGTGVLSMTCTDQLQERMAAASRTWVAANVDGYWSKAVFGEPGDTWQYALDRLSTVPAALDLDAYGMPRVTQWRTKAVADVTLAADDIVDASQGVELAARSDIRSQVSGDFQYRFYRLRGRGIQAQFNLGSVRDVAAKGLDMPSKAMIEQAIAGMSGWTLRGKIGWAEPPVGSFGGLGPTDPYLIITAAIAPNVALAFSAFLTARWGQSITETTTVEVVAAGEINSARGARESIPTATLDADFDVAKWEASADVKPALEIPLIGDTSLDVAADGTCDRAAANDGIKTMIARGRTRVLATHRLTRVTQTLPVRPEIDLPMTVAVATSRVRAQGKVVRVEHTLSLADGRATTTVGLAISGYGAAGLVPYTAPDDIADPAPFDDGTATKVPALAHACEAGLYIGQQFGARAYDEDSMIGFTTNAKLGATYDPTAPSYPIQFSIKTPEIEATSRDALELPVTVRETVSVPTDIFEVTL